MGIFDNIEEVKELNPGANFQELKKYLEEFGSLTYNAGRKPDNSAASNKIGVVLNCFSMDSLSEVEEELKKKGFFPKITLEDGKKIISFEIESDSPEDFKSI